MRKLLKRLVLWCKPYEYGTCFVTQGYTRVTCYRARRHKATGTVYIWCREWMPTDPEWLVNFVPQ